MTDTDSKTSQKDEPDDKSDPSSARSSLDGARIHDRWFDRLKQAFGLRSSNSIRDDLEDVLAQDALADSGNAFEPEERFLIRNALQLRGLRTEDVMIPRADIDSVDQSINLGELMRLFEASGHSRMPVHDGTLDAPVGMVHIKDLMSYFVECAKVEADPEKKRRKKYPGSLDLRQLKLETRMQDINIVRDILFVPLSMPAMDLMAKMQAARTQMALVVDEYGGTDGLVCFEDIVETVVGDIEDEHDDAEDELISQVSTGTWLANARVELDKLKEETGLSFQEEDLAEEVDTLGGLLVTLFGRVPVRGELLTSDKISGYEFEILDADPRRLKRLRIHYRNGVKSGQDKGEL